MSLFVELAVLTIQQPLCSVEITNVDSQQKGGAFIHTQVVGLMYLYLCCRVVGRPEFLHSICQESLSCPLWTQRHHMQEVLGGMGTLWS